MKKEKQTNCVCFCCGKPIHRVESQIKKSTNQYCSYSCLGKRDKTGSNNPRWNGGRIKKGNGRVAVYAPNHPDAVLYGGTHILEYRLIAEKKLGRRLLRNEIVHHKDGNAGNNEFSNLEIMTQKEHARLHVNRDKKTGQFKKGGL